MNCIILKHSVVANNSCISNNELFLIFCVTAIMQDNCNHFLPSYDDVYL